MKCDSRASLSIRTFASPSLGREPEARVTTPTAQAHFRQHIIPHALVGILKNKGKSFHDRMDAPT